jgi:hypothetical protein
MKQLEEEQQEEDKDQGSVRVHGNEETKIEFGFGREGTMMRCHDLHSMNSLPDLDPAADSAQAPPGLGLGPRDSKCRSLWNQDLQLRLRSHTHFLSLLLWIHFEWCWSHRHHHCLKMMAGHHHVPM